MNSAMHIFSTPSPRIRYNNAITSTRDTSINRTGANLLRDVKNEDHLYVSLDMQGNRIAELKLTGVTSLSDIIAQLRYLAAKYRGLAQMYIRNMTAGWSMQRPLMLC